MRIPVAHPAVRTLGQIRRRIEPVLVDRFLAAAATLRSGDRRALETALTTRQPEAVLAALPWDAWRHALDAGALLAIRWGMAAAGRVYGQTIPVQVRKADPPVSFAARFDLSNPRAVVAAARQSAWLVQGIDLQTRQALADVIRRGQMGELTVIQQARLIEQLVGLNIRQANAVANYEWGLRRDGRSEEDVVRLVQRRYDHTLRYRATTIARTESARAAVIGQNELWRQAADDGYLDRQTTLRTWIASPGACPICQDLARSQVALEEPFGPSLLGDTLDGPPAHPDCRCALSLETGLRAPWSAAA